MDRQNSQYSQYGETKYTHLDNSDSVDNLDDTQEVAQGAFLASVVVRNPFKFITAFLVCLSIASWGSWKTFHMKEGITFIPMGDGDMFKGFPKTLEQLHDAMVFWCDACDLESEPDFPARIYTVEDRLNRLQAEVPSCEDLHWSGADKPDGKVGKKLYWSEDKTTTFIEFHSASMRCMMAARKELKQYTVPTGMIRNALGGPETVADASMSAEFLTALRHAAVAMPVTALILWMVTGNAFRASSPMICVVASYLTGKATLGFCKSLFPELNINFDDSAVLFIVLALCVDYAFFLWTRLSDIRSKYPEPEAYNVALVAALHKSGTVIVISNCFVTIAYGCTMLFPCMNLWGYLGLYLQACFASMFSMIYSVCLLPSLAAGFPMLFDGDTCWAVWDHLPSPHDMWLKWSRIVTSRPRMFHILIIAYSCMLFCMIPLSDDKPSFDIEAQGVRWDLIESKALAQFERKFKVGILAPTTFVLEAKPLGPAEYQLGEDDTSFKNVALSPEFGEQFCEFAQHIMEATQGTDCQVSPNDMFGLWWVPRPRFWGLAPPGPNSCANRDPRISSVIAEYFRVKDPLSQMPKRIIKLIPHVLLNSLSHDGLMMQLKVMTQFRPTSPEAYHFDQIARDLSKKAAATTFESGGQRYTLNVQHASPMQIQVDASRGQKEALPMILGLFGPLAALTIGLWFKSAFLAVKLAFTVIVPIMTTYGMAVAVYQLNELNFLGIHMLEGGSGLDFRMIILTAGILFGFAMDYDLFLFVRVYEYRQAGYDNLSAVKRSMVETGPVITTVGSMMAFSFFCIMCSHTMFLRTMGFIFTVGVSFDVFVVRTMIAPVFLSLAEGLNYWPGKMPTPSKTWDPLPSKSKMWDDADACFVPDADSRVLGA
jgi:predicted RND superfamily exporter protein